jgi:hypothetical protein
LKYKTISERENFLRAIERRNPQWILIKFEMFPAVWKKYGLIEKTRYLNTIPIMRMIGDVYGITSGMATLGRLDFSTVCSFYEVLKTCSLIS